MKRFPEVQQFGLTIPLKSLAEQRFESPSVSVVNGRDLVEFLLKLISETYFKCGISTDAQELKAITMAFKSELQSFPYLTLKELQKCFSDGYKEKYGKYYGLSVKTFVGWIDFYIQNERNAELNSLKKEVKKEDFSEREKKMLITSGMSKCILNYEEKFDILEGYVHFMYDVLFDDGFLPKDKETKSKFYDDAKMFLEMQSIEKKSLNDHHRAKEIKKEILKQNSPLVITQAKEMIVLDFLRKTFRDPLKTKEFKIKYNLKNNNNEQNI